MARKDHCVVPVLGRRRRSLPSRLQWWFATRRLRSRHEMEAGSESEDESSDGQQQQKKKMMMMVMKRKEEDEEGR